MEASACSCRKLRSVEAALDLLDSFRSMQSGAAVQQLMASKLTDILNQFSREIDAAMSIFHHSKVTGPLLCLDCSHSC